MNKTSQLYLPVLLVIIATIMWFTFRQAIDITTESQFKPDENLIAEKPVRYFGVVSRYTPREIYRGYQPIMDYLTENTPFRFELKLSESYKGTVHQLGTGEISIASLGSFIYVTMKDEYNLEVILKPLTQDGNNVYQSMFITQDTSTIQRLTDLKGKSVVFPSKESLTGQWMPTIIYNETNLESNDLKKMAFVSHHTTVAAKVLSGEYDAGVVKAVVAKAYRDKGLRIFHTSPPRPTIPLVVSAQTDSLTRQSIIDAFLKINPQNYNTKLMLSEWDEELSYGFQKAMDSDYDPIRQILKSINKIP